MKPILDKDGYLIVDNLTPEYKNDYFFLNLMYIALNDEFLTILIYNFNKFPKYSTKKEKNAVKKFIDSMGNNYKGDKIENYEDIYFDTLIQSEKVKAILIKVNILAKMFNEQIKGLEYHFLRNRLNIEIKLKSPEDISLFMEAMIYFFQVEQKNTSLAKSVMFGTLNKLDTIFTKIAPDEYKIIKKKMFEIINVESEKDLKKFKSGGYPIVAYRELIKGYATFLYF